METECTRKLSVDVLIWEGGYQDGRLLREMFAGR